MFISLVSCEDVVHVDLETSDPRLVIEASILWEKGTVGNEQKIKLSTTTDYYSNTIPVVSDATVFITDSSSTYNFIENPGTGEYFCDNFNPVIGETYVLTVVTNGETYQATETLIAVPTIDSVEQGIFNNFGSEDIQVKFYFQDNPLEDNYYFGKYTTNFSILPSYDYFDDKFTQGNQMFGLYIDEDIKAGDQLTFNLQGISKRYYNYVSILLNIAGNNSGGPFTTPPATVRGNFINITNPDNFAFGYFCLSEMDTKTYVIE